MKIYIRRSAAKKRKMVSFRRRMSTRHGRAILNRQRALACGRKKKKC